MNGYVAEVKKPEDYRPPVDRPAMLATVAHIMNRLKELGFVAKEPKEGGK